MAGIVAFIFAVMLMLLPTGWKVVLFSEAKDTLCYAASGQKLTSCSLPDGNADGKRDQLLNQTPDQVVALLGVAN